MNHWSYVDLLKANELLDIKEEMEAKQNKKYKKDMEKYNIDS